MMTQDIVRKRLAGERVEGFGYRVVPAGDRLIAPPVVVIPRALSG
jgi:hypothetical protein